MEYVKKYFPTFVDSVIQRKNMFLRIWLVGNSKIINLRNLKFYMLNAKSN